MTFFREDSLFSSNLGTGETLDLTRQPPPGIVFSARVAPRYVASSATFVLVLLDVRVKPEENLVQQGNLCEVALLLLLTSFIAVLRSLKEVKCVIMLAEMHCNKLRFES